MRQLLVRSYAVTHRRGSVRPPQAPGWDQLVLAATGSVRVSTASGSWAVPAGAAAAIPDPWVHRCHVSPGTALRVLYARSDADLLSGATAPHVVVVDELARALVRWLARTAPVALGEPEGEAALVLLRSLLEPVPLQAVDLPLPADDTLAALAARVRAEPDGRWTPTAMAAALGVSRRTLERWWRAATGASPAVWARRARLLAAAQLVATGEPVGTAAAATGWSSPSAFAAAFSRDIGCTPSDFASIDGARWPTDRSRSTAPVRDGDPAGPRGQRG